MRTHDTHLVKAVEYEAAWREAENQALFSTLFLSWGWGEYKKRQGWGIKRFEVLERNSRASVGLVQVQHKRLWRFGPRVILVQGGPVLSRSALNGVNECMQAVFRELGLGKSDMVIAQPCQAVSDELRIGLMESGFSELRPSGSSTLTIDLGLPLSVLESRLSTNWRHNLRRSEKKGLLVKWVSHEPGQRMAAFIRFATMYDFLTERKVFTKAIDIGAFGEAFLRDDRLELVEIVFRDKVIASRVGFLGRDHMLDVLAASSEESRNTYANYLAMWSLVRRASEAGAAYFDCGGIDPRKNHGVYLFKKGLSGSLAEMGSVWVHTRVPVYQRLVAAAFQLFQV